MKGRKSFRIAGAIAIIIMATSAISLANISDAESEVNPEVLAPSAFTSWTFLGSTVFGLDGDKKTIRLSRAYGKMAKIQLRLRFNQIEIDQVVLHFKGGGTQEVKLEPNILGERIYLVNVKDGAKKVRKITVTTSARDTDIFEDHEMVEVWGVPTSFLRRN